MQGTGVDAWSDVNDTILQAIAEQGIAAVMRAIQGAKPAMADASSAAPASVDRLAEPKRRSVVAGSTAEEVSPQKDQMPVDADEALRLINSYRKSKELKPLALDEGLMTAAAALSADMAKHNRLSHVGPGKADLRSRLKTAG
jgi:uncharacterized protein YkwD